jgi:hypothetical protein
MHVLLLSTHAPPITAGNPWDCIVPRWDGATRPDIPTSLVLQEYTTNMRGVDVGMLLITFVETTDAKSALINGGIVYLCF